MPHRRKTLDNICQDLIKKQGTFVDPSKSDDEAEENQECSINSDLADIESSEPAVSPAEPTSGAISIECFHCRQIFSSANDIQRHLIEQHVNQSRRTVISGDNSSISKKENAVSKKGYRNSSEPPSHGSEWSEECSVSNELQSSATNSNETHRLPDVTSVVGDLNDAPPPEAEHSQKERQRRKRKAPVNVEGRTLFKCDSCDFSALSPAALTVHQKTHSDPDRANWHKCQICPFTTKSFPELFEHGDSHRTEDGDYMCPYCQKRIETYAKARRHVWQTHVDMNVVCKDCGKKFLRMERLRKHAASAHSELPAGHCQRCGKAYRRKDKLKEHQECCMGSLSDGTKKDLPKKRSGPKCVNANLQPTPDDTYVRFPFRCDICRIGFKNHSDLLIHVEARHHDQIIPVLPMSDIAEIHEDPSIPGQQYLCDNCQLSWSTLTEVKLHIALDHPTVKGGNFHFECPFCPTALGRNYPERERLMRHCRRQHRPLVTPFLRSMSSTSDQDVACNVEIGLQNSSLSTRSRRLPSKQKASKATRSSNIQTSVIPEIELHMDTYGASTSVIDDLMPIHGGVVEPGSPNFFSCTSLANLSANDAHYAETMHHVVDGLADHRRPLDALSSAVVVDPVVEHQMHCHHDPHAGSHHHHHHHQLHCCHANHHSVVHPVAPSGSSVYDPAGLVCYGDAITGLVGHDVSGADNYMMTSSPLPLPTSVLTACFDSPLTGPLNSHAYQLLE